jgi:hypothetical protein
VLGVATTSSEVFLAVMEGTMVLDMEPAKLPAPDPAAGLPAVSGFLTEFGHALAALVPTRIALLLPESNYQATYGELAPRGAAEALVMIAAERAAVPVDRIPRATIRSKFNLAGGRPFDQSLADVPVDRVGPYWIPGRRQAAVAAFSLGVKPRKK